METIAAIQDTLLKKTTLQSSDPNFKSDVVQVKAEKKYEIETWQRAADNHIQVKLAYNAGTWFIFAPHWNGPWGNVILPVPYLSQRDNRIRPSQTCNMTSAAMVIGFYYPERLKGAKQLEDELTQKAVSKWGNDSIYYHARIVDILKEYGVESKFSTTTSWADIKAYLDGGNPVIYSGKFTKSGHIIVLRGYDETGFFVNDPWGEWFASGYQNKSGENLHYSFAMMERLSYGGSQGGWAHLCSKKSSGEPQPQGKLDGVNTGFIKRWEGLRLNAYRCSAGIPTIGYGSTFYLDGRKVKMGDSIKDEAEANALLNEAIAKVFLPELRKIPGWAEMNVNQRTALASFAYNLGASFYTAPSGFATIQTALRNKQWDMVPAALKLYVKETVKDPKTGLYVKRVNEGLVNRRHSEAKLWNSNITWVNGGVKRL